MDYKQRVKELEEELSRFKSATSQWELIQNLLELSNRKLFETEKKLKDALFRAEEGTRAKSIFLANMSHEIRTPLNGIIGMAEILRNTELDQEQLEYLDIIMSSSESLLQIINDILDFSKIEAGKVEIEHIPFELRKIIYDIANILIPNTNKKGVEIITFIDPVIPSCLMGDPVRLRQVILNMANNAVKFTNDGEVFISAEMIYKRDDKIKIRISVNDTGIGISRKNQHKIFSSFSQADSSTTRKYGGTGLGLSISKKLVECMEGDIGLESEVGVGSDFYFNLTFDYCDPDHINEIVELGDKNTKVVVVDDNKTLLKVFESYLEFQGYQHTLLCGPGKLLETLEEDIQVGYFNQVVFIDYNIKGQNAGQLVQDLKKNKKIEENVKFVLLIPLGVDELRDMELKSAFDEVLTKPLRYHMLKDVLLRLTGVRETARDGSGYGKERKILRHRVLVVDDNKINLKIATAVLSRVFKNVHTAENGKEAISLHRTNKYDIIFMDLSMPDIDGIDTTKIIRKEDDEVIIIAASANAMREDVEKCLESGMNDHISKPYKEDVIWAIVKKYLEV
jgi:signal transduction histidine kinase/DNA-binding response OmpR family regulator